MVNTNRISTETWKELPRITTTAPVDISATPGAVVQNKQNSYIPLTTSVRLRVPLSLDHYPLLQILFLL